MAFIGHPVLADIRRGMRLRPTHTVDKSKPMIQAEGERLSSIQPGSTSPVPPNAVSPLPPAPLAPPPPRAGLLIARNSAQQQSTVSSMQNKQQTSTTFANTSMPSENQRQKLLAQIRGGVRLRHVQTADKSGLILDEQLMMMAPEQQQQQQEQPISHPQQQHLMRPATPNGSLDSQGISPSPSMAACSSTSGDSCSSWLSPSPPVVGATAVVAVGVVLPPPLWLSPPPSSSDFSSPPSSEHHHNHQQQRQQCSSLSSSSDLSSPPHQRSLSSSAQSAPRRSPTRHWPEVQPAVRVVMGSGGTGRRSDEGSGKQADYHFDEQKQIEDRRQEVATLAGNAGAQSKIAAFRQLQSRLQQQPEPKRIKNNIPARSFCTLPRTTANSSNQQKNGIKQSTVVAQSTRPMATTRTATMPTSTPATITTSMNGNNTNGWNNPRNGANVGRHQQQNSQQQQQQPPASVNGIRPKQPNNMNEPKKQQQPMTLPCNVPSSVSPPSSTIKKVPTAINGGNNTTTVIVNGGDSAGHQMPNSTINNVKCSPPPIAQPQLYAQTNNTNNATSTVLHRSYSSSSQLASIAGANPCATPPPSPKMTSMLHPNSGNGNGQQTVPPAHSPFFRPYTPRTTRIAVAGAGAGEDGGGGPADSHRQNFERIRGRFAATKENKSEEEGRTTTQMQMNGGDGGMQQGQRSAETVWKNAAQERKQQQQQQQQMSPVPPPLPDCPPPPLNFGSNGYGQSAPPDWSTLRDQFRFAVDLDGGSDGKALIRIVRR